MTNQQDNSIYRTGDLVIGSSDPGKSVYSPTGEKLIEAGVSIFGSPEDLEGYYKDIVRSATMSGGKKIPLQQAGPIKKTKKAKNSSRTSEFSQSWTNFQEPPAPAPIMKLKTIQFENSFGKIKAKVEHVLNHDQAYMLIFSDEDSVVFEPKVGEQLVLHTEHGAESVYYPGVTFDSPQDTKKLMILFKVPAEDQE
jgi:hypothetical protein